MSDFYEDDEPIEKIRSAFQKGEKNMSTEEMHCKVCEKLISFNYFEPYKSDMRNHQLCFKCLHWWTMVTYRANGDKDNSDRPVARIAGEHYIIGEEEPYQLPRGYGGHRFGIRFFDGREVITTNLWHQGTIPEHFQEQLPNNAEFMDLRLTCITCHQKFYPIGNVVNTTCLTCDMVEAA